MPFVHPASEPEGHNFKKFFNKLSGQPSSYAQKADYIFGKTLGAGSFGIVRQARRISTKEEVAIKIVLKKALKGNEKVFYDELALLQKCKHPNIVGFRDWFESKDKFYIVTQLATGGELFDRIVKQGKFTEEDGVDVVVQILQAVEYLHDELNIVHRDLKPENLLYISDDPQSQLVLADFGIAKELLTPNEVLTSAAGSFGYCAPEVLTGTGHGKPCDIWSLGVIAFTLLGGYSPFRSENVNDFLQEVQNDPVVIFHKQYWKTLSEYSKNFIKRCLIVDPNSRPSAKELLSDPWITTNSESYDKEDLAPQIRKFNAKKKFRQAVEIVKLNNRIKKLRELEDFSEGEADEDSDLEWCKRESDGSSPFDLSSLVNSIKSSSTATSGSSAKSEERSELNASLFHQVVRAATNNKEKVLNYDKELAAKNETDGPGPQ
ncbi:Calcium/calmodulin-dependent protein kinase [Wickerhamomyces ciferrii]|uniref:calcium/calmodulin-dependent protein kinase n=1 Tax=Wickerhamomyces ciferrii (strain ATCC 14091 / BCRC 22168 / CBS 111 / JCM 3599 / NBRC 0793 / NRRL Y-1031 F-60-10) TaxID=1206466 RepID=K0KT63_WICCF|nr:Calcium/calmodulin-dependent protein kinase [Wickerhamomyces ciferrii]CCH46341.1 Calcium/calmodulin-dependent protein kinase [Wickerhamomyces ciferrii]